MGLTDNMDEKAIIGLRKVPEFPIILDEVVGNYRINIYNAHLAGYPEHSIRGLVRIERLGEEVLGKKTKEPFFRL